MTTKEKILQMRAEFPKLGARAIALKVGCSRALVRYHTLPHLKKRIDEQTTKRRWSKRDRLIKMFGARCFHCGFDKYTSVLDFHHIDPNQKKFMLALYHNRSFETQLAEAKKCVLLCANCHRALHAGDIVLQVKT